jgi:hypothetical protein
MSVTVVFLISARPPAFSTSFEAKCRPEDKCHDRMPRKNFLLNQVDLSVEDAVKLKSRGSNDKWQAHHRPKRWRKVRLSKSCVNDGMSEEQAETTTVVGRGTT